MKRAPFAVKCRKIFERDVTYSTFQVVGYLNGERIRRKFKDRDEAEGEKARLEIQAANAIVRPVVIY